MGDDAHRVQQYRYHAEELRMIAEDRIDEWSHATLLRIACDYERMAEDLERHCLLEYPSQAMH